MLLLFRLVCKLGACHCFEQVMGFRGAYERTLKLGYGLSILGTVPLVVMPFRATLVPLLAAGMQQCMQRLVPRQAPTLPAKASALDDGGVPEQMVTVLVMGGVFSSFSGTVHRKHPQLW